MQLKQLFHTQILSCYFFFPDELCEACIHTCDHALLIQQTTLVIYNLKYDMSHLYDRLHFKIEHVSSVPFNTPHILVL